MKYNLEDKLVQRPNQLSFEMLFVLIFYGLNNTMLHSCQGISSWEQRDGEVSLLRGFHMVSSEACVALMHPRCFDISDFQ